MTFGYCYDAPERCSGMAQPGTRVLRDTIDELLPWVGDYGIYNCRPTRTGKTLSLHGEGRAWDAAIPVEAQEDGTRLAAFFVAAATDLGIQRVIWGFGFGKAPKEWDSRPGERYWEGYSGPAHDDHIHVELCWAAARNLTDDQVRTAFARYWEGEEAEVPTPEQWQAFVEADQKWKGEMDKKMLDVWQNTRITDPKTGGVVGLDVFTRDRFAELGVPPKDEPAPPDGG